MARNRIMKNLAPLLPSFSVMVGLYWIRDAWITLILYHLGMALYLVFFARRDLPRLLFRGHHSLALPASLVCALGGVILAVCWPWFATGAGNLRADLAGLGLTESRWLAFLFYYAAVNPILEELFWRGWLGPATRRPHWHDLAFAAYHGLVLFFFVEPPWILLCVGILTGVAWIWRWMARSWGGRIVPVTSHLAADVSIIAAACFLAGCNTGI